MSALPMPMDEREQESSNSLSQDVLAFGWLAARSRRMKALSLGCTHAGHQIEGVWDWFQLLWAGWNVRFGNRGFWGRDF